MILHGKYIRTYMHCRLWWIIRKDYSVLNFNFEKLVVQRTLRLKQTDLCAIVESLFHQKH